MKQSLCINSKKHNFSQAMKVKVLSIFLILASNTEGFFHWLKHHLITCPFKSLTSIDCPGCGIQRSIVALLQGDFLQSLKLYPATIPIIALFGFTIIHLKFELKNGAFFIKMLYIAITLIIVTNYIYKILTNQLI